MEERALYQAILAAPHDDTPRLVYADWLQEHADGLPGPAGQTARVRAEFIRLQCAIARGGLGGWGCGAPSDPALARRERRLLFTHGRKWRRAVPAWLASHPFDRGFLRPYRALYPDQFLGERPVFPPVPPDSPARDFLIDEDPFSLCPLWDIHLYAPDYPGDPTSDVGQYGEWLARVAASPSLARVGWLQVSFFRTSTVEFLRTGNFANVETLVLNCWPYPAVLEAVAENASFRSLRYVLFGGDRWAWAGTRPAAFWYMSITPLLDEANRRHLPFGEMWTVLRDMMRGEITVRPIPETSQSLTSFPSPLQPPLTMTSISPTIPPALIGIPTRTQVNREPSPRIRYAFWSYLFWSLVAPLCLLFFVLILTSLGGKKRPREPLIPNLQVPDWIITPPETIPVAPPPRMVPEKELKRNE